MNKNETEGNPSREKTLMMESSVSKIQRIQRTAAAEGTQQEGHAMRHPTDSWARWSQSNYPHPLSYPCKSSSLTSFHLFNPSISSLTHYQSST